MALSRNRAKQFAKWDIKPVKDYDIEADQPPSDDNQDNDSDEAADKNTGTEHYVAVGKSKLRQEAQKIALGPEYHGKRVSREALDQFSDPGSESGDGSESSDYEDAREDLRERGEEDEDEFDDPDNADLERDAAEQEGDAEIDSDNAFGESDEEKFEGFVFRGSSQTLPVRSKGVKRPVAADFLDDEAEESEEEDAEAVDAMSEDENEDEEDEGEEESMNDSDEAFIDDDDDDDPENGAKLSSGDDEDGDQEDNGSEDDEDSDEEEAPQATKKAKTSNRGALSEMMSASVTDSLASSIQKDVAKGHAVRKQRTAFDAALNVRIRLQKALVSVNSLNTVEDENDQSEAYSSAEALAIKLWNSLDEYRTNMQAKPGQKRKRDIDLTSSSREIWDIMQDTERIAAVRRRNVIENWSSKVKKIRTQNDSAGGNGDRNLVKVEKPLTMMLEEQMDDPERLIKRTRTPRSCAPAQVAAKVNEDANIYDDADFYQLLLKELVDQRSSTSVGGQAATIRYAAVKEAKTKKHVDTKASKGRKLRFTTHEKLLNFMAPEDRRSWEQHAIDRFFGSLFGQKMVLLNEDDVSDEESDDMKIEDDGIRLFRS